jgi:serine protease AprX
MRYFLLIINLFALTLNAQNFVKIDPSLFPISQNNQTPFFIVLKEQADLSQANQFSSKEAKGAYVFNVLRNTANLSQAPIQDVLKAQNIDFQSFWIVNAIFTKGDRQLIEQLAMREDVAQITSNPKAKHELPSLQEPTSLEPRGAPQIAWGVLKIKADSVWALGYKGNNVVIAGQDTGYDWEHPSLKPKYRGWNATTKKADHNYNWHDSIHKDSTKLGNGCGYDLKVPCDDDVHGTHTMGTMLGSNDTLIVGVAPAAKWIGSRNMDRGNGTLESYVESFQWFLAPTDTLNKNPNPSKSPHVINNSWYCSEGEGCNTSNFSVLEKAMNACRAAGIVVVVSAGNSGSACSTVSGPPAFFSKAFSIGATRSDDTIAGFSSRGPVLVDSSGRLKPNVSAPGVGILSTFPNGNFGNLQGTSMAGPHVAGVVALMISANPKLAGQVDTIERIIELTAKPMMTTQNCGTVAGTKIPNNTYGFGRVDALAAVKKGLLYKATAVKDIDNQIFAKVFPNPFLSEITFYTEGVVGETQVQIFNVQGQSVFATKSIFEEKNSVTLVLPPLTGGLYFYTLTNGQKSISGKIIKK